MSSIFILSRNRYLPYWLLLASMLTMATVLILQGRYNGERYGDKDLQKFQYVVHEKEEILESHLEMLADQFIDSDRQEILSQHSDDSQELADAGIFIFYYDRDILSYWSDHTVSLRGRWRSFLRNPVFANRTGIYLSKYMDIPEGKLYGLIKIKNTYSFENAYLKNHFQSDFDLRPEIELLRQPAPGLSDVNNKNGEYLFSLNLDSHYKNKKANITFGSLLFFLSLVLFFVFISLFLTSISSFWWITSLVRSSSCVSRYSCNAF
jgi:two-component system nitrogen regulation sensor histidine kinase NtrY